MTLGEKQSEFTNALGQFLVWLVDKGYQPVVAEVFRTKEQAEIYAAQGKGIKNSVHTKKLAADIFLKKDGVITWEVSVYEAPGEHWKSLHDLARWGGDFQGRDAVHFSFEHGGVK